MCNDEPKKYKFNCRDRVKLTRRDIPDVPCGTVGKVLQQSACKTNGSLVFTNHAYYVKFDNGKTLADVPEKDLEKVDKK